MNELMKPWTASDRCLISTGETHVDKIISYANGCLTEKQQQQIVGAFQMGAFDMASEYAWKKAIMKLRSSLSSLGMDFIAEFVQRSDVDEFTPIENVLTERATIDLAERLGVISSTGALKLRQGQELINHYMSGSVEEDMDALEALNLIKNCVEYILSDAKASVAIEFSDFRERLLNEDLQKDDSSVQSIINAPLFYIRTVITILLTAIKKSKQTLQEHAISNFILFIPEIWSKLASSDKWNIGETYRDVVACGDTKATKGLKIALGKVSGFDFVPETYRSSTYREVAKKLIDIHDSVNNFYNELNAVKALSNLGTRIPEPAFLMCIDAYLLVYLGNYYGVSFDAAPIAKRELMRISQDRWQSYFTEYIQTDDRILSNLETTNQVSRFSTLLKEMELTNFSGLPKYNQALYDSIIKNETAKVSSIANAMYRMLV